MSSETRAGKSWGLRGIAVALLAMAAAMPMGTSASAEQGPATIDVTNYPAAARESYKVFAARCTRCHELSRPITAAHVLPDQWKLCVDRMTDKWFSGINQAKSQQILDFLIYDSSVRKQPLLEAALAKLSADARKAAEDRIAEIRLRYEKESPSP